MTESTPINAAEYFDRDRVARYEQRVRQIIPGYEACYSIVPALLSHEIGDQAANILVVGSGTGMELVTLGQQFPTWRLTGIDPSEAMTAAAQANIIQAGLADRVSLHLGYLSDLPIEPIYQAATAILVMHFLPDDGQKLAFLKQIAQQLEPGSPLILIDQHGDIQSPQFQKFMKVWKRRQCMLNVAPVENIDVEFETHMLSVLRFASEPRTIELLEEAGFGQIDRFFQALLTGGWIAIRQ